MGRLLFIKGVWVSVIALFFGLLLWGLLHKKEPTHPTSVKEEPSSYPLRIERISESSYDGNRLITRIEIDEFKVNQRRFFVFNIRPFNEVTLTNTKLEVHDYDNMSSKVDLFPLGEGHFSSVNKGHATIKGLGLVTRAVIKGLTLEVYKADRLSLVVKAEEAYINFKNNEVKIMNGSLEKVDSKKVIWSKSIIWDKKEKVFKIPGIYMAQTPRGRANGKGIKVDLDFAVSPLGQQG